MGIDSVLSALHGVLRVPAPKRNGAWALKACEQSRAAHIYVWEQRPPVGYARQIMDLLSKLARMAQKAMPSRKWNAEHVAGFADNIARRAANIGNYVAGRPSSFAPADLLSKYKGITPEALIEQLRDRVKQVIGHAKH
jgi:hypothetical protein